MRKAQSKPKFIARESATRSDLRPVLKWAGGKTQLLPQLENYFPKQFKKYFEPFAGGLAVFFHLRKTRGQFEAFLSDYNFELVNCYKIIQENARFIFPVLSRHQDGHNKVYYLETRRIHAAGLSNLERAARLIYLNKTCYNGLYRVNSNGEFNVPMGSYRNPKILDEQNLLAVSSALKNTTVQHADFGDVIEHADKGDFVYFDPPYYTEENGFTGYIQQQNSGKAEFGAAQHLRLAKVAKELKKKGCYVLISNSESKFIKSIYNDFTIYLVHARNIINCNGNGRGLKRELIITNI